MQVPSQVDIRFILNIPKRGRKQSKADAVSRQRFVVVEADGVIVGAIGGVEIEIDAIGSRLSYLHGLLLFTIVNLISQERLIFGIDGSMNDVADFRKLVVFDHMFAVFIFSQRPKADLVLDQIEFKNVGPYRPGC